MQLGGLYGLNFSEGAGRARPPPGEGTPEARRKRATKLAHERGGITKAAGALISPAPTPRNAATLELLR